MATATSGAVPVARSEPRTRTALLLESIALRHQIAVLERSRTRRPCFRSFDRLFWILLSRWWSDWRESLVIVQAETALRWRRKGWSAMRKYRSGGRWRGGRPRVSREIRGLITRMARENFLWGAPRIHGELRMLGFSVSQATVSRYMPTRSRRPTQSWRTFLRNQASALSQYYEERSRRHARLHVQSYWDELMQSAAAQIATVRVGLGRGLGYQHSAVNARGIVLRSAQRDRGVTHRARRVASVPGGSRRALNNRSGAALLIRSPPHQARASQCSHPSATHDVALVHVAPEFITPVHDRADTSNSTEPPRAVRATPLRLRAPGLGFEKGQEAASALVRLIERVGLKQNGIHVSIKLPVPSNEGRDAATPNELALARFVPMRMKRRGVEMRLIIDGDSTSTARVDLPLLNATARAYRWSNDLLAGRARSIAEIARREHLTARHVRRVMRLAFLAPRIVKAIAEGRQPADLTTLAMTQRIDLPPLWSAQQQALEPR
jgi:hypothetical protein